MPSSMPSLAVNVDAARCTECGACRHECPLVLFAGRARIEEVTAAECLRCGHCVAVCPTDAVTHALQPAEGFVPYEAAPTADDAMRVLAARHSVRHYARRPVSRAQWDTLLVAMGRAPSGTNARPVRAIVVSEPEVIARISSSTVDLFNGLLRMLASPVKRVGLRLALGTAFDSLRAGAPKLAALCARHAQGADPIFYNAPGVLILHADRKALCGRDDCLLAAMAAMLTAPGLGLGTCMIGFVLPAFQRQPALRTLVGLPEGHVVHAVLAIGHPGTRYLRAVHRDPMPATFR